MENNDIVIKKAVKQNNGYYCTYVPFLLAFVMFRFVNAVAT